MRIFLFLLFLGLSSVASAQLKTFLLEGQVVDQNNKPIPDVYVVNLSNMEKDISRSNGVFSFWVAPSDTLVLSHISYNRKKISVTSLLVNPIVRLQSESVDIPEVRVSPDQLSDIDRANKNLQFMQEYKPVVNMRMKQEEADPVSTVVTENNDLMRSEASSINIVRFSPSEQIGELFTKLKKKDYSSTYKSTRKQMDEVKKGSK